MTVYQWKKSQLAACTYTMHALSHVAQCMAWLGPLSNIWQFPLERFCGLLVSRCKSRAFASANIHQVLMVRLGLQAMMKTKNSGIHLRNSSISSPTDILHYPAQDLFFLTPKKTKLYEMDNEEFKSLQDYYAIQERLPEVAIIRRGMLWKRMENKRMIFGFRYIFL